MLEALNIFFFVFHTAFTLFNMVGWIFKSTRKWHLLTIGLTAASWFILGIWYGLGYCACTDWHWRVREQMGIHDQSRSYIHFLILKLTGVNMNARVVETWTLILFIVATLFSITLSVKDWRQRNRSRQRN